MKSYLLDTSALLTLRDSEPGAQAVVDILTQTRDGRCRCYLCFISLMEVYYRVWKDEDRLHGKLAYEQCRELPIEVIHESVEFLEKAAEIKATNRLSLADAWIAAAAYMKNATLIHKDPEFEEIDIQQLLLPYK